MRPQASQQTIPPLVSDTKGRAHKEVLLWLLRTQPGRAAGIPRLNSAVVPPNSYLHAAVGKNTTRIAARDFNTLSFGFFFFTLLFLLIKFPITEVSLSRISSAQPFHLIHATNLILFPHKPLN